MDDWKKGTEHSPSLDGSRQQQDGTTTTHAIAVAFLSSPIKREPQPEQPIPQDAAALMMILAASMAPNRTKRNRWKMVMEITTQIILLCLKNLLFMLVQIPN